jgi:hypothetical protein
MKLSPVKLFDATQIDPETAQKLEPLISYMNQNFDVLITALQGKLSFGDNIQGEKKSKIRVTSGIAKIVATDSQKWSSCLVTYATRPVTGFSWKRLNNESIQITAYFDGGGEGNVDILLF